MSSSPAFLAALLALTAIGAAHAQTAIAPPQGAVPTAEAAEPFGSHMLAVKPFGAKGPTEVLEGSITTRAWSIAGPVPTMAVLRDMRDQILKAGFTARLDCDQDLCGGYDFRFSIPVLPPPEMEVDLTDYRYFSATRGAEGVSLLVSRTAEAAWLQLVVVGAEAALPPAEPPETPVADLAPARGPVEVAPALEALVRDGRMVLEGLEFASGRAELAADPDNILAALAAFLADQPAARLILVGHTDNEGSLAANIEVSRRRAEAVRDALVSRHGVDALRLSVEGVGYLAPRTANATDEGRALNRRVEVVLN